MEYSIIKANGIEDGIGFEEKIEAKMMAGYKFAGGICVDNGCYYQAMYKD